jgi:hypothetical protein
MAAECRDTRGRTAVPGRTTALSDRRPSAGTVCNQTVEEPRMTTVTEQSVLDYAKVEIRVGARTVVYELVGDDLAALTGEVHVHADVRETTDEQPDPIWRTYESTGRRTVRISLSGVVGTSAVTDA